jgi:hypothetical protein
VIVFKEHERTLVDVVGLVWVNWSAHDDGLCRVVLGLFVGVIKVDWNW